MPSVLWLCEYPELHGAEQSLLANRPYLREAGYEPIACAPPEGMLAQELAAADVAIVPLPALAGGDEARQRRRDALAGVIERVRPDLLHANSLAMGRLSGPVVEALGIPSLAHLRDIVGLSRASVADLNRHARLIAVSRATARFHAAQGADRSKLYTLYNGVALDHFTPRPPGGFLHQRLGLPETAPLLGAIGQIGLRKGYDVLLTALEIVLRSVPDAQLVVVGARTSEKEESRAFERSLIDRSRAAPLAGHVHWLGTTRDVPALLAELTLLVHPSRQEPLGRVLLEAAAAGRAIVATDVGGTREMFPAGSSSARLAPPDDAAALAAAMLELLADKRLRDLLACHARRRAERRFDIRRSAQGLLRHYDALCRAGRSR